MSDSIAIYQRIRAIGLKSVVALIDLVMALVELVIERIDLHHRIARRNLGLYAGDVTVTDARRLSAKDSPSDETGLDHEQPLVQSDNALPIDAFDAEADMFVLVNSELEEPPDSSVIEPRSLFAGFLLCHLAPLPPTAYAPESIVLPWPLR